MVEIREILPPADLASEADIQAAERHYLELLDHHCVPHIAWQPQPILRIVGQHLLDVGGDDEFRQISRGLWGLLIPHRYAADVVTRAVLPSQGSKKFVDQLAADYFVQVGLVSGCAFIASTRVLALIAHIFVGYGRSDWQSYMPWGINVVASFAAPEHVALGWSLSTCRVDMGMTLPDAARSVLSTLRAGQSNTFGSARIQPTSDSAATSVGINLIINDTVGAFVHVSGCAGYGPGAHSCLHIPPLSPVGVQQNAYHARFPEKKSQ